DGLSGQVSDREIGAIVSSLPPAEACKFLINLANLQGGPDNITAIIVQVGALGSSDSSDSAHDLNRRAVGMPRISFAKRVAPILKRLPWQLLLLILGIVLAIVAIYLKVFEIGFEVPTFVAAAAALIGGLAGLMWHGGREPNRVVADEEPPPTAPHIYRERA